MKFPDLFHAHEIDFMQALGNQAAKTREGFAALRDYVDEPSAERAKQLAVIEEQADEFRRALIEQLNRDHIRPVDDIDCEIFTQIENEDLFELSRAIDDVLDYGYTTVDEMVLFGVKPNQHLKRLAAILYEAADELYRAVVQLRDHPKIAIEHTKRVKELENTAESEYRKAIADLFQEPKSVDALVEILKMREIYRHLSNAADHGDEAANLLGDLIMKII
jgi:uncharacterized protein